MPADKKEVVCAVGFFDDDDGGGVVVVVGEVQICEISCGTMGVVGAV